MVTARVHTVDNHLIATKQNINIIQTILSFSWFAYAIMRLYQEGEINVWIRSTGINHHTGNIAIAIWECEITKASKEFGGVCWRDSKRF